MTKFTKSEGTNQAHPHTSTLSKAIWLLGALLVLLIIGAAIGFDDFTLTSYQLKIWDLGLKTIGGAAVVLGALGGGFRYFQDRRDRLAWDKTRFIVELSRDFDDSGSLQRAMQLIDRAYQTSNNAYLEKVLSGSEELSESELKDRYSIDRYLDFFDRLMTHVFITKTLSRDDASSFSGYVTQIAYIPPVTTYALEWGYEDVVLFGRQLQAEADERVALADRLEEETPDGAASHPGTA